LYKRNVDRGWGRSVWGLPGCVSSSPPWTTGSRKDERRDEPGDNEAREDEIAGRAEVERGEDELTHVEDEPTVAREVECVEPADSAKVERSVADGGAGRTSPAAVAARRTSARRTGH
jgi:hypothetical protein